MIPKISTDPGGKARLETEENNQLYIFCNMEQRTDQVLPNDIGFAVSKLEITEGDQQKFINC